MSEDYSQIPRHCVLLPFLNRLDQVAARLSQLIPYATPNTFFLLVDDGSSPPAHESPVFQDLLSQSHVHLIRHSRNYGIAAARNSGLYWCRHHGIEIVIMLDSDCEPEPDFIIEHLRLHRLHPEAVCIGGQIVGRGKGLWARLDGLTSWVHASRHSLSSTNAHTEFRGVEHPFHLAATNFSAKLDQLPMRDFVFEERLRTGEDCLLTRELRRGRDSSMPRRIFFSSSPRVYHDDRDSFLDVVRHHYEWGHHQYFVQLGGDLSSRCFERWYRLLFVVVFAPLLPVFALLASLVNSKPLFLAERRRLLFFPLIYMLWLGKGVAILEAATRPKSCLLEPRPSLDYEEPMRCP